uniref:Synembryn n=1 Tax=Sinocyclocheilus rhinocerous TaxID=307959 RepID=A0A673MCQ2_9TELE
HNISCFCFVHCSSGRIKFLQTQPQGRVLKACLRSLRILLRDKKVLGPLITDRALLTLAHLGGISHAPVPKEDTDVFWGTPYSLKRNRVAIFACHMLFSVLSNCLLFFSLLCGLTEKLNKEFQSASSPCGQFYALRLMFLLTALRPELRAQLKQEGGVPLLTTVLEKSLSVQWKEQYEVVLNPTAPPISVEDSQQAQEALKILFNITHNASLYRHLAAVLHHCLMVSCEEEEAADELKGHAVNMLSALPLSCLDVLVSVPLAPDSHQMNGANMDCVHNLFMYMDRKLEQVKERLTPVLNLLTELQILPPLRDASTKPEEGNTMRNRLVRLMTNLDTELKHCAADLLFMLCKESGNATSSGTQYSSDSDSDTEEYRQIKDRVNPVTGQVEEEQPDPMEGMTEEEKEEEAHRLISLFNKLSKDNMIQPMGLDEEGQLVPLSELRDLSMEETKSEEEHDDLENVEQNRHRSD